MARITLALIFLTLLLIPQPAAAIQDDDTELRLIEAEDPLVQQQGEWILVEDTDNASGEGYLISGGESNDELGLLFEGTRIEVIYLTDPDYGTFHIEVDNDIVQTVDAASDESQFDVRAVVEDLEPGFHIIRVIADSGAIAVDDFEVTPTEPETLQTVLPETVIVDQEVMLNQLERHGRLWIIIVLDVPTYQTLGRGADREEVLQRKANIDLVRNTLLAELEEKELEVEVLFDSDQWVNIPGIELEVDAAAFNYLLSVPYIRNISAEFE